jgi:biopolymer transport protein ExbD
MPLKLSQEENAGINLTSMIDVLFLLIIFFMVGTRFSENEGSIEVNLPKLANGGAMLNAPAGKVVALRADKAIVLDNQVVSIQQLEQILQNERRNYPDVKVSVKADGDGSIQSLSEVLGAIQRAGVSNLHLLHAQYQMPNSTRR